MVLFFNTLISDSLSFGAGIVGKSIQLGLFLGSDFYFKLAIKTFRISGFPDNNCIISDNVSVLTDIAIYFELIFEVDFDLIHSFCFAKLVNFESSSVSSFDINYSSS